MGWVNTIDPEPHPPGEIIPPDERMNDDNNDWNEQRVETQIEFQQQLLKMSYNTNHNYWCEKFNKLLMTQMNKCDKLEQEKREKESKWSEQSFDIDALFQCFENSCKDDENIEFDKEFYEFEDEFNEHVNWIESKIEEISDIIKQRKRVK